MKSLKMTNDLTEDQRWFKTTYKHDKLPLCEQCGNPYGEQNNVRYGCSHHKVETNHPYFIEIDKK